ncbi:hypothetical protein [uncultured Sphingomonas sp.]|uniref:hypothetical protein n=1 Tax=uncultured Sphingomonas sp. TaxID=158754 RepID=UPI0025D90E65|nr:hypothetical protein [uncultured Sphingomonas sp.]
MRFVALFTLPIAMIAAQPALAKGCIRGAVAGGVAGHMVGKGHGKMGAVAGCIAMHHHYSKQAKAQAAAAKR